MTDSSALERRYRRLLALYPRSFRREREEEILAVLMAGARGAQRWPRPAEAVNLLRHAPASRLRQGPPPDTFARRHPRGVILTRVLVALWLVFVTIVLSGYTLWALLLLVVVALHAYLAGRTAVYMRSERRRGDPPS